MSLGTQGKEQVFGFFFSFFELTPSIRLSRPSRILMKSDVFSANNASAQMQMTWPETEKTVERSGKDRWAGRPEAGWPTCPPPCLSGAFATLS